MGDEHLNDEELVQFECLTEGRYKIMKLFKLQL